MINQSTNHSGSIGYSGKITLTTLYDDKVVSKKEYHNTGTDKLFYFLCQCIAGTYNSAEFMRPSKIRLFYNQTSVTDGNLPDMTVIEDNAATGFISAVTSATIIDTEQHSMTNEILAYKTTLHFLVPYAAIKQQFNQICLYGVGAKINEPSAYFFLTTPTNDGKEVLNTIDPADYKNFNLMVDWTLQLENKADQKAAASTLEATTISETI